MAIKLTEQPNDGALPQFPTYPREYRAHSEELS